MMNTIAKWPGCGCYFTHGRAGDLSVTDADAEQRRRFEAGELRCDRHEQQNNAMVAMASGGLGSNPLSNQIAKWARERLPDDEGTLAKLAKLAHLASLPRICRSADELKPGMRVRIHYAAEWGVRTGTLGEMTGPQNFMELLSDDGSKQTSSLGHAIGISGKPVVDKLFREGRVTILAEPPAKTTVTAVDREAGKVTHTTEPVPGLTEAAISKAYDELCTYRFVLVYLNGKREQIDSGIPLTQSPPPMWLVPQPMPPLSLSNTDPFPTLRVPEPLRFERVLMKRGQRQWFEYHERRAMPATANGRNANIDRLLADGTIDAETAGKLRADVSALDKFDREGGAVLIEDGKLRHVPVDEMIVDARPAACPRCSESPCAYSCPAGGWARYTAERKAVEDARREREECAKIRARDDDLDRRAMDAADNERTRYISRTTSQIIADATRKVAREASAAAERPFMWCVR